MSSFEKNRIMIKASPASNQTLTPSRMQMTVIVLCLILSLIMFLLYSNTTLKGNFVVKGLFIAKNLFIVNSSSTNITQDNRFIIPANQKIPLYPQRRFAIFACSIHSKTEAYTFYSPITAASWQRVGYEAIVIFVGDFTLPNVLTARLNLSRNYLKHVGAHVIDIQCNSSYAVKVSQLVRVFAGFLPDSIVHDEDDILTGDSDLIPLKPKEYIPTPDTDGFIFNAFCCGSFKRRERSYRMFPMGHIYLKKKVWRAIVLESKQRAELLLRNASNQTLELASSNASLSFDLISLYARHEFQNVYDSTMNKGDSAWYMDQVLCSMLLTDYREKHKELKIHERGRAARLDRADSINKWNRDNFDHFGDAHLIHDSILQAGNWKIFNKLLKALFSADLVQLFNDYYRQYIIAEKAT